MQEKNSEVVKQQHSLPFFFFSLYRMASRFNAFTCIWLDASVDSNAENKIVQDELRQIINQVVTCDNVEAGEKRIRKNSTESIILIVSGTFGREIIPKIHDLSHLVAFYVYCQDRKRNEQWANQYPKVIVARISHRSIFLVHIYDFL